MAWRRPFAVAAEGDRLAGVRPVAGGEHLRPGQHDPHRTLEGLGRQRRQEHRVRGPQAGAEGAADVGVHHLEVATPHAEGEPQVEVDVLRALVLVVDRQLAVALPHRGGGEKLHRVVELGRGGVLRLHLEFGGGQGGVGVAARVGRRGHEGPRHHRLELLLHRPRQVGLEGLLFEAWPTPGRPRRAPLPRFRPPPARSAGRRRGFFRRAAADKACRPAAPPGRL